METLRLPDRPLRLAFFGTPEIAATVLERLLDAGEDRVVLVVCQPDRPRGRGQKLEAPPVKALAEARGLPVRQPVKLRDGALAAELVAEAVDLAVVVAYGRILPRDLFEAPAHRTWNVHASLLPRHRGASPIQRAILAGDAETGVTLMLITEGLDEGAMLHRRVRPLDGTETAGSLTADLATLGADALLEGLRRAKTQGLEVVPQDDALATHAPLIEKAEGLLDLGQPAAALDRRIRGLSPWPSTFVPDASGAPLKILAARAVPGADGAPGTVATLAPGLCLHTGEGWLELLELQPAGKRPMSAADFLRGSGRHLAVGAPFPGR
jgi:methionyl-tRNA formyltransferase